MVQDQLTTAGGHEVKFRPVNSRSQGPTLAGRSTLDVGGSTAGIGLTPLVRSY